MTAQMAGPGAASSPVDRMIKDLSTRFVDDPRTIAEKLQDFLNKQTDAQHQAIACKVIADMADNRDALGDQELDWLYRQQTGPVVKRVVAQVLSLRGDNRLLDAYIAEHQAGLASDNPGERRKALGELAKTRYAGAADMIVPLLGDTDTTVVLDALLALRATGNERHIGLLQELVKHPDPSVSWLAADALNNLETLSEKARIRLLSTDIVAELPPIAP
jgi:HEAT repeat protein